MEENTIIEVKRYRIVSNRIIVLKFYQGIDAIACRKLINIDSPRFILTVKDSRKIPFFKIKGDSLRSKEQKLYGTLAILVKGDLGYYPDYYINLVSKLLDNLEKKGYIILPKIKERD